MEEPKMKMNKSRWAMLLVAGMSMFNSGCGCTTVRPGFVGIKVPLYGSKEEKTEYQTCYGRVWYNSFFTDVYVFPTFMQQVVWTKSITEGNPHDESISFSSTEGKVINCDIAFAYNIKAEMVTHIFRDQRKTIEEITSIYLRSKVRDSFVRHAAKMNVQDIVGPGKDELIVSVKKDLEQELGPKGYVIDMVSIVGEMRLDEKVQDAINSTIQAQLKAVEAENKVKQSEAEARQDIAKAEGEAQSKLAVAKAEAEGRLIVAKAEAEANKTIQESLSPEVLQYQAIKIWNGQMPLVNGSGATPLINIDPLTKVPAFVPKQEQVK
jgi:regulator of protease activity HflC (stomatin/prohibitin superfamily)